MTKTCFRCGAVKLIGDFYPHPGMGDGRLGKCKECAKCDVRENRASRREHYLAFDRGRMMLPGRVSARQEYARTERGRTVHAAALARQRAEHPEKHQARNAVNNALRDGRLLRQPCELCGAVAQAHHEDYARPLDVRWLCVTHHRARHREIKERTRCPTA